jgi:hypothetical protein
MEPGTQRQLHVEQPATDKRSSVKPGEPALTASADRPLSEEGLLHLQRLAGNRAVTQALDQRREHPLPIPARKGEGTERPIAVQRHSSWEHKLLGDVNPATLQVITRANEFEGKTYLEKLVLTLEGKGLGNQKAEAVHAIQQQLDNLQAWQQSPPGPGQTTWKGLQLVTIKLDEGESVVCSLGEMNTLADYYGSLEQLKKSRAGTLTSILQTVRKQSWVKLHEVLKNIDPLVALGRKEPNFEGAQIVGGVSAELALEMLTADGRNKKSETYLANAARNACHFAPQSWFRWKEYHEKAREIGARAWRARLEADKKDNDSLRKVAGDLANEAIMTNGFGDHYLQDSFAAGHLINKVLIMQWFVEWMGSQNMAEKLLGTSAGSRYLKDWDRVQHNTTAEQGKLAGRDLYKRPKGAVATDPQSAEEEQTRAGRIGRLGLQGGDKEEAYRNYLAMIDNAAIQLATKELHDHFCEEGLTVFNDKTEVGKVYGDDNMVKGGEGIEYSAQTAKKSQQAITALTTGKTPELATDDILQRLPNRVQLPKKGGVVTLEDWHQEGGQLKEFCEQEMFPKVHYILAGRVSPTPFGEVSKDVPGGDQPAQSPQFDARMLTTGAPPALVTAGAGGGEGSHGGPF